MQKIDYKKQIMRDEALALADGDVSLPSVVVALRPLYCRLGAEHKPDWLESYWGSRGKSANALVTWFVLGSGAALILSEMPWWSLLFVLFALLVSPLIIALACKQFLGRDGYSPSWARRGITLSTADIATIHAAIAALGEVDKKNIEHSEHIHTGSDFWMLWRFACSPRSK